MKNQITNISPKNILIIRLSAIGDTILSSPIAKALKEKYPDSKIFWAVDSQNISLVKSNPYVDHIFECPVTTDVQPILKKIGYIEMLKRIYKFRKEVRQHRYDLSIDCQGLLKSGIIAGIAKAKIRVGPHNARENSEYFITHKAVIEDPARRLCQRNMDLLKILGIDEYGVPVVVPLAQNEAECENFLSEHDIAPGGFVAFCYASSVPQKDLPVDTWGEAAQKIFDKYSVPSVLFGGPERKEEAEEMAEKYPHIISAAGDLSLLTSMTVIQKSLFAIGVDTGTSYGAFAKQIPLLLLFGSTPTPVFDEKDHIKYIFHHCEHSPCHRRPKCEEENKYHCMTSITADEIMEKVEELEKYFINDNDKGVVI